MRAKFIDKLREPKGNYVGHILFIFYIIGQMLACLGYLFLFTILYVYSSLLSVTIGLC